MCVVCVPTRLIAVALWAGAMQMGRRDARAEALWYYWCWYAAGRPNRYHHSQHGHIVSHVFRALACPGVPASNATSTKTLPAVTGLAGGDPTPGPIVVLACADANGPRHAACAQGAFAEKLPGAQVVTDADAGALALGESSVVYNRTYVVV